ncbi:hypothetical protein GGR53DRAFT_450109 [Hypoxylon sp. FL1150]|nr:hypothetical protein GGR53DRAFT_450109 [Hypoxylon sp. FL1150]
MVFFFLFFFFNYAARSYESAIHVYYDCDAVNSSVRLRGAFDSGKSSPYILHIVYTNLTHHTCCALLIRLYLLEFEHTMIAVQLLPGVEVRIHLAKRIACHVRLISANTQKQVLTLVSTTPIDDSYRSAG